MGCPDFFYDCNRLGLALMSIWHVWCPLPVVPLLIVVICVCCSGRWYIREGWLNVVPPKGTAAKPKMFFLFSDMLLQAKRCSTLLPSSGDRFVGQCAYPLLDCTVEKVFGHTKSQGGLLSVSQPMGLITPASSIFTSIPLLEPRAWPPPPEDKIVFLSGERWGRRTLI